MVAASAASQAAHSGGAASPRFTAHADGEGAFPPFRCRRLPSVRGPPPPTAGQRSRPSPPQRRTRVLIAAPRTPAVAADAMPMPAPTGAGRPPTERVDADDAGAPLLTRARCGLACFARPSACCCARPQAPERCPLHATGRRACRGRGPSAAITRSATGPHHPPTVSAFVCPSPPPSRPSPSPPPAPLLLHRRQPWAPLPAPRPHSSDHRVRAVVSRTGPSPMSLWRPLIATHPLDAADAGGAADAGTGRR